MLFSIRLGIKFTILNIDFILLSRCNFIDDPMLLKIDAKKIDENEGEIANESEMHKNS